MVADVAFQTGTPPTAAARPRPASESAPRSRRWRPRLSRVDRTALAVWLATRAGLLVLSLYARYATSSGRSSSWLGLFQHWDWYRYLTVAEYGYTSGQGPAYDQNITAFLPGYPLTLRFVHFVVRDWAVSGLLISFVAGGVAVVALARLTEFEYLRRYPEGSAEQSRRAARTAVLLLVCAPAAVFLAVGYTEALFLAFAVPAWLAARRGQWVRAGILLAFACTIRINGLFVLAGVGVMFLTSRPTKREWLRQSPALLLPLLSAGVYAAYLKDITGDWLDWLHAEKRGWSRSLTNPISAWRTSWNNAFGSGFGGGGRGGGGFGGSNRGGSGQRFGGGTGTGTGSGGFPSGGSGGNSGGGFPGGGARQGFGGGAPGTSSTITQSGSGGGSGAGHSALAGVGTFDAWAFRLELLAAIVGVATVVWLGWRRRWAELTYVGISVIVLITSTYYMSIPREMLLWWPLWVGAAIWLAARRWATIAVLSTSGVLMVGVALLYFSGQWAG
jgi:Mannosyltransferase (PIG-V)